MERFRNVAKRNLVAGMAMIALGMLGTLVARGASSAELSPVAADRLRACGVDKDHRGREKASDHAPTWIDLGD